MAANRRSGVEQASRRAANRRRTGNVRGPKNGNLDRGSKPDLVASARRGALAPDKRRRFANKPHRTPGTTEAAGENKPAGSPGRWAGEEPPIPKAAGRLRGQLTAAHALQSDSLPRRPW